MTPPSILALPTLPTPPPPPTPASSPGSKPGAKAQGLGASWLNTAKAPGPGPSSGTSGGKQLVGQ